MVNEKHCKPKGGYSKISQEARQEVNQKAKAGEFYKNIADEYGITRGWVYKLVKAAKEVEA
jgi:hypothetical protein